VLCVLGFFIFWLEDLEDFTELFLGLTVVFALPVFVSLVFVFELLLLTASALGLFISRTDAASMTQIAIPLFLHWSHRLSQLSNFTSSFCNREGKAITGITVSAL
jgi:hypothetical protein